MNLRFTKMHGLGNDYVYVNAYEEPLPDDPALPELARRISDRHRGVGGDGLILIGPPSSDGAHVRMRMFNADGSESQMCGNGVRCVGKFVHDHGLSRANPLRVQTGRGVLELALELQAGKVERVRVDMGAPILEPALIPVALPGATVLRTPLQLPEIRLEMTCVSMGNPHAVFFVDDVRQAPLETWGPLIENHPLFPERINAHFVRVLSREKVEMRTWERGTGITQACGTGACAVCVAGVLNERTARRIAAQLPGGELEIEWDEKSAHVFKTGPATEVFQGLWQG